MTNFIFTNRFGNPHNPASVNRTIKRIVDAHNSEEEIKAKKQKREPVMVPRFSCHVFRHTFASRFCENETLIQEALGELLICKTVIIIAHRLRTVENCDKIIALNEGKLIEQGTHNELMDNKNLYHKLFTLQKESLTWTV